MAKPIAKNQESSLQTESKDAARQCLIAADKFLKDMLFASAKEELDKAKQLDPSNVYIYAFQDRITYFEEQQRKAVQAAKKKETPPTIESKSAEMVNAEKSTAHAVPAPQAVKTPAQHHPAAKDIVAHSQPQAVHQPAPHASPQTGQKPVPPPVSGAVKSSPIQKIAEIRTPQASLQDTTKKLLPADEQTQDLQAWDAAEEEIRKEIESRTQAEERLRRDLEARMESERKKRKELEERIASETRKRRDIESAEDDRKRNDLEQRAAEEERRRRELEDRIYAEEQRRKELELRIAAEERKRREIELLAEEERKRKDLEQRAAEEERKRRELEARAAEEERKRKELEEKIVREERLRLELEAKIADERRRKELEEQMKREIEAKLREEQRQREEQHLLEEQMRREQEVKAEEEKKRKELVERITAGERRRKELEAKLAEEERLKQEEIQRAAEEVKRIEVEQRAAEEQKRFTEMRRQIEELSSALENEKKAREEVAKRQIQTAVKQFRVSLEAAWVNGAPLDQVAQSIHDLAGSLEIPAEVEASVQREVKIEMYSRAVKEIIAKKKLLRNSSSTLEWLRKVYQISIAEYLENESKFLLDLVADQYKGTVLYISKSIGSKYDITQRLKSTGYAVVQAKTPEQALEKIEKVNPNVILCDAQFPGGLSGLKFLHLIRINPKCNFIPFIILSEPGETEELRSSELRPNEGVTELPIEYEQIVAMMQEKLARLREYISSMA
ncbi:MAG: response regulator [bacterium]